MILIVRAIEEIPVGTRIAAAFVQSAAVRAAGFAIVPLASLAPAVKILYVIMMVCYPSCMVTDKQYISIYPIALSVRSTNVYEERSLGLFDEGEVGDNDEPQSEKGAQAVAKYVGWQYVSFPQLLCRTNE
jgi:Trk-type K+ transport system membrane component